MDAPETAAASAATEETPLLLVESPRPPRPTRTVTFNANPVSKTIEPEPAPVPRPRSSHHYQGPGSSTAVGMAGPPMLTALNSKLRRRNSHGGASGTATGLLASGTGLPHGAAAAAAAAPKIGPQRSTKNAQKLKLLPNPEVGDDGPDEESGRDVYSQYTRIKDPTARRDAARLGKADRDRLPRVTAYCTANKYQMEGLMRFLKGRGKSKGASPKLIDECIYTPYDYRTRQGHGLGLGLGPGHGQGQGYGTQSPQSPQRMRRHSDVTGSPERYRLVPPGQSLAPSTQQRQDSGFDPSFRPDGADEEDQQQQQQPPSSQKQQLQPLQPRSPIATMAASSLSLSNPDFDTQVHTPEVFLFDYGVVVIWGMSLAHEERFLKELAKFEVEKLAPDDVETEHFNFYYTREYQARIYNDFITLRDKNNYTTKLAISHALAQSVRVGAFPSSYMPSRPPSRPLLSLSS